MQRLFDLTERLKTASGITSHEIKELRSICDSLEIEDYAAKRGARLEKALKNNLETLVKNKRNAREIKALKRVCHQTAHSAPVQLCKRGCLLSDEPLQEAQDPFMDILDAPDAPGFWYSAKEAKVVLPDTQEFVRIPDSKFCTAESPQRKEGCFLCSSVAKEVWLETLCDCEEFSICRSGENGFIVCGRISGDKEKQYNLSIAYVFRTEGALMEAEFMLMCVEKFAVVDNVPAVSFGEEVFYNVLGKESRITLDRREPGSMPNPATFRINVEVAGQIASAFLTIDRERKSIKMGRFAPQAYYVKIMEYLMSESFGRLVNASDSVFSYVR